MMDFRYPASVEETVDGSYIASFRDVPEAEAEVWSADRLKSEARGALITALGFYAQSRRTLPPPSAPEPGDLLIELPPSAVAKLLLIDAMAESGTRPSELAKRMGIQRQDVTRITNLHHVTKIDTIAEALQVLGLGLKITVSKRGEE